MCNERREEAWTGWPPGLALREPEALRQAREEFTTRVERERVLQFIFHHQWESLHYAAGQAGLSIVGDLPIYVAHNSADVWAQPELFQLNRQGQPEVVAGVPADYFSPIGQRWGNPLYGWATMETSVDAWWHARVRRLLTMLDVMRLDHFRAFQVVWEIPVESETALSGRWAPGPGERFFENMRQSLGALSFIAEDLGVITEQVVALRNVFQLPGMRVLQLAFNDDSRNPFLPHNFSTNTVVYTGTHDNDTAVGWFAAVSREERDLCCRYLNSKGDDLHWDLIRTAWSSVAGWAVAPMRDLLRLGSEARMNVPSRSSGNWRWRVRESELTLELAHEIEDLNQLYGRK